MGSDYFCYSVFKARMALRMTSMVTPTSANTASPMGARPNRPSAMTL